MDTTVAPPDPVPTAPEADHPGSAGAAPADTDEARFARGIARGRAGDRHAARDDFRSILPALGDPCRVELALLDIEDGRDVEPAVAVARDVIARAPAGSALHARALHVAGLGEHRRRRPDQAILDLAGAGSIYRALGLRREEASVQDALGRVFAGRGRVDLAIHHYAIALAEKALAGDRAGSAMTLVHLGRVHLQAARGRDAIDSFERALELADEARDHYARACALNSLGEAFFDVGDLAAAESRQRACLEACSGTVFPFVERFATLDLALVLARRHAPEEARAVLASARVGADGEPAFMSAHVARVEGEILIAEGAWRPAVDRLDHAVRGLTDAELPDEEMPARIALARALVQDGRPAAAEQCLLLGVRRARREGNGRYLAALNEALTQLGAVASAVDDTERAFGEGPDLPPDAYVIRERLGGGGFGEVYRAYDPVRATEVAVKRLHLARLYDPRRAARLLASIRIEIEAASRLDHPGVAKVYAVGRTSDGDGYVVEELVRGRPLRAFLPTGPDADVREVLSQMSRIALALQALHDGGVIHRDLKPENVILRDDGTPVLIDFGIAQADGFARGADGALVAGTPGYMAPEQALGRRVDARADLYALGVITYEWLTGVLPLHPRGADFEAQARDIATRSPAPLVDFRPALPDALVELVHALLEKKPRRRPSSAAEVADRLASLA